MIKRVNTLEHLGEVIRKGDPTEVSYGPGEGEKRAEALITYLPNRGRSYSARTELPIRVELRRTDGDILMDVTDPNGDTLRDIADSDDGTLREITNTQGIVRNAYRGLRLGSSRTVTLEPSANPPYEFETLVLDLEEGKLAIAPYLRPK